MGPGHLLIGLDVLAKGLREWQLFTCLLRIVITLLNCIKFHIFIPISNAGLVGVLWSSL